MDRKEVRPSEVGDDDDDYFGVQYAKELPVLGRSREPEEKLVTEGSEANLFDRHYFPAQFERAAEGDPDQDDGKKNIFDEQYFQKADGIPPPQPEAPRKEKKRQATAVEGAQEPRVALPNGEESDGMRELTGLLDPVWKMDGQQLMDHMLGRVLFQNEWVVAFDKPYGLACASSPAGHIQFDRLLRPLADALGAESLRPLFYLDRQLSGVVPFATSEKARQEIMKRVGGKEMNKHYMALVTGGLPHPQRFRVTVPLRKITRNERVRVVAAAGEKAADKGSEVETECKVLAASRHISLLRVRTQHPEYVHQIRAHLSMSGCPLIGDKTYGPNGRAPRLDVLANAQGQLSPTDWRRLPLFLHLNKVELPQLEAGKPRQQIVAPLPSAFKHMIRAFRLMTRA